MLTAEEFLPKRTKRTSKGRVVTWELSANGSPTILDAKPDKHTEAEVMILKALSTKTGQDFSAREVSKLAGVSFYMANTVLAKMARHEKLKRIFGNKFIRYQVL